MSHTSAAVASDHPHIDQLNIDAFHARYGSLERVKVLAEMALAQSRQAGYVRGIVESQNNIAFALFRNSEYIQATKIAQETLAIAREHWLIAQEADTCYILGSIRRKMGDSAGAFEQLSEAIALAEKANFDPVILAALNGIAIIYINMGEHERAISYFERSLEYNTDPATAEQNKAVCLNNCCLPYLSMGNHEMALKCGRESLEIFRRIGDSFNESFALMNIANAQRSTGDLDGALEHYQQAMELALGYGETYSMTLLIVGLSETYLDLGRVEDAVRSSEDAITHATANGSALLITSAYKVAATAQARMGNYQTAYDYLEQYRIAQDELYRKDINSRVKALQSIHDVEKTRKEAELHRLRNAALEKQIKDMEQISLIRHEQERLTLALAQEHELSQIKTGLIDHVSLKLRTPLTIIQSSAAVLKEYHTRLSQEKVMRHIDIIDAEIKRTIEMVDEILRMAQGGNTIPEVARRRTNLREICMQVVEEIVQAPQERSRVIVKVAQNAMHEWINPLLVSRSLSCLLDNALRYSSAPAPIQIRVSRVHGELIIRVRDSGIGIDPEEIGIVTRPMYRGRNIGSIAGMGLGMTIAHNCITAHRGTMHIESRLNAGTTVTLRLPVPA